MHEETGLDPLDDLGTAHAADNGRCVVVQRPSLERRAC